MTKIITTTIETLLWRAGKVRDAISPTLSRSTELTVGESWSWRKPLTWRCTLTGPMFQVHKAAGDAQAAVGTAHHGALRDFGRTTVAGTKELIGVTPTSWMTLTRTQVALCATGGVLCLALSIGVRCALAAGDGDPGSRSGWNGGGGAGFRDDTCCSNMAYTANARYRIKNGLQKYQPQPFFKGQILSAFGRDVMHALGLEQPAQRGDWTVGGFGFGAVTHEMRGPGGTIGPI